MADDRPVITQQYSFAVGDDDETDGAIEPAEESVETSLETWGADVDHREQDTCIEQPEASSFGVDDRKTVTRGDGGEQRALFANTTDDQQTLTGEHAASQCLFESDDTNGNDDETDDQTSNDELDIEPAASTNDEATTRAVATDGGHVEDPDGDDEDDTNDRAERADERAVVSIPRMKLAVVADYVEYERNAVERHAGEGPKTEELTKYVEECRSALSVLDDDDEHAQIRRVVAAGAADELHRAAKKRTGEVGQKLQRLVDVLRSALDEQPPNNKDNTRDGDGDANRESDTETANESDHDDTFDADEETVTDAWEGAYISTNWGYGQTNVELAQISEVSDSGKTVLARLVGAERVGHGRTSKQLRPTANQYGDEFRLHVRSGGDGDPMFRGSYPLGSDGDMDDGPTRRGWFSPFDNDPENSIRATRTGFGH